MAFTGNSNYSVTAYTAFAVAKAVTNKWSTIWTENLPLLSAVEEAGTNFNTADIRSGTVMQIPIAGDRLTTPTAGVADASELTPDTLSATNGFSGASYYITHYRAHANYRASETFIAQNGGLGNFLQGKVDQVISDIKQQWEDDAATTTVDSRTKIMGYRYALSTSNSPGGISQATDSQWQAHVKTSAGTFGLNLIDDQVDAITAEGKGGPDLILAGLSGSSNMYGKIRTAIGPTAERLVNPNGKPVKYGLNNIQYLGALVMLDNKAATGEINVLSTGSWYVYMPRKPMANEQTMIPGTDARTQAFTLFTSIGTNDPSRNARITGVT